MFDSPIASFSQIERSTWPTRAATQVLFATALVASAQVLAADNLGNWSLDINGVSKHSESRYTENGKAREYNETNTGLGASVEWLGWNQLVRRSKWTDWIDEHGIDSDIKFGFFDNSYDETSLYAGLFLHKDLGSERWKFAPGLGILMVTGYDDTPEDAPAIFPLPVFGLEFGHKALKFNLGYVPWGSVDFVTLQLQVSPAHW